MDNKGYFLLHRKIRDHWIWEDPKKFQWWIDIILLTNHTDKKAMIGGQLIVIKRGSFHTSEIKLSERWNTSRNTVRKFLETLEIDEMITAKKTKNGTTIFLRNYEVYQSFSPEKKQQIEQQTEQQTEQKKDNQLNSRLNTTKELNTLNTLKEVVVSEDFSKVYNHYQTNIQMTPPQTIISKMSDDFDFFGSEIMIYAIDKSAMNGNRDYRFIDYLLKDWRKNQLSSLAMVQQYEEQRHSKNNNYNKNDNYYSDYQNVEFAEIDEESLPF